MKYHFYNLALKHIGTLDSDHVAEVNPYDEGYEVEAAIQVLFGNIAPPTFMINLVRTQDGYEHWSVGPYDLYVKKESEHA
jgi:hypothetical protein